MRSRTLRQRIIWSTAIISALAMLAMIGTIVLVLAALTRASIDSALDDRLALVSSTLQTGPGGVVVAQEIPDDSIDDSTWVYDAAGRELEGPKAGKRLQDNADALSTVTTRTTVDRGDRVYLAAPVTTRGSDTANAVVVVSESLEPYETTRLQVIIGLSLLGVAVTAGSTAIAAWAVRRALAPVESMAARAEDWSEHDLEARFGTHAGSDEIAALSHTLNLLLDRVAGALRSEQRLTSELAHELRTPLTAIRGEAEIGLMTTSDSETEDRLHRVVDLVERMNLTIGTLLAVARGDTGRQATVSVADVVSSVLDDHPRESRPHWSVDIPDDLLLAAPIELATRALAPLVDNAARFAGSVVDISSREHDRTVDIIVSDDGEGVGTSDLETIFTAGNRRSDSDGAGLGLSLARRVARTLGGDVVLSSASSPTVFILTLPRF